MAHDDDSHNSVGYKKPPSHTQFKPGQSGNVKGRPKGAKNFATIIETELRSPIEVTENGKRKRLTKQQAIVKQTVNKAVAGDPKATTILLSQNRFHQSQDHIPVPHSFTMRREDHLVIDHIVQRIWQSKPPASEAPVIPTCEDQPTSPTQPTEGEL